MGKSIRYFISIYVALIAYIAPVYSEKQMDILIVPECNKNTYYSNETGKLTIWLYSADPNINGVSETVPVTISDGGFSYITRIAENSKPVKRKIKGKEYYAIPIATYAIMIKDKGKFNIHGGEYKVGVDIPVVINDRIFGSRNAFRSSVVDIEAQSVKVKVKSLPSNNNSDSFTGAIGDYSVNVIIPPGEIIVNEPAIAIIKIEGTGLIGDDTMPDYHKAFSNNIRLKSINEKNDYYYDGNNVISQKLLECEFIPTSRDDCEIGTVEFGYFNPNSGKYEVAKSEPVTIDVKSSIVKITPFDI